MCGIGGIVRVWANDAVPPPLDRAIPNRWIDVIDQGILQRGPDSKGQFRARNLDRSHATNTNVIDVALIHRRLAVIDPVGGAQPMLARPANADFPDPLGASAATPDPLAVVFNGCIYNHRTLRTEIAAALAGSGCGFTSHHSDTEVIPWGWRAWGIHLRAKLQGMYAFALWDPLSRAVILGRDLFGEKPLHVLQWDLPAIDASAEGPGHPASRVIAFASQPGGLLPIWREWSGSRSIGSNARDIGARDIGARDGIAGAGAAGVASWLMFGCGDAVPLQGFSVVPPGQWWRVGAPVNPPPRNVPGPPQGTISVLTHERTSPIGGSAHNVSLDSTWPDSVRVGARTRQVTVAQVEAALEEAVVSCLEADVPVGCFLSGGVDSALIAALAFRNGKDRSQTVEAFTVRMNDARYDESAAAARTAKAIGIKHHVLDCEATPAEDLQLLIAQMGVPFGDSSLLPSHWVSRAARRHVTVCLSGDGGDELFAGYERHRAAWVLASIGPGRRALGAAGDVLPKSQRRGGISGAASKARRLSTMARHGYARIWSLFEPEQLRALGVPESAISPLVGSGWDLGDESYAAVGKALDMDRDGPLAKDMLPKVDAASMACALEVRAPMLAYVVASLVGRADVRTLMPGGRRKALLRQVLRRVIPGAAGAEIVGRSKMGFAVPIGEWYRTDFGGMRRLLLETLTHRDAWPGEILGFEVDRRVVRKMIEAHATNSADHTHRLHALLVLALWARNVLGKG